MRSRSSNRHSVATLDLGSPLGSWQPKRAWLLPDLRASAGELVAAELVEVGDAVIASQGIDLFDGYGVVILACRRDDAGHSVSKPPFC
jgi:hypothetical protein